MNASALYPANWRTTAWTTAALVAFAANSLLCRAALGAGLVDAASFTSLRVVGAVVALYLLLALRARSPVTGRGASTGSWPMAAMLCLYLLGFSFAYRSLSAGTGALLLFGAVQLTMLVQGWRLGERLSLIGWVGFLLAVAGLVVLLLPGATAPDPLGAALMVAAGVGWGVYSLLGRGAERPLRVTAWNFLACMAPVLVVNLLTLSQWSVSLEGALLALASGALASGLGYVAWYTALPGLSAGRAATVQLSVPVMTALGGVVLLGEPLGSRLVWASFITLGGIALVLAQRYGD